jgi:ribonuclease HI
MKQVVLFTDGSCLGNPGPGGWACLLRCSSAERELTGSEPDTTNNRMELKAVIAGLSALKERCAVRVVTLCASAQNVTSVLPEIMWCPLAILPLSLIPSVHSST